MRCAASHHGERDGHTDGSALANPTSAANTRGRPPPGPHPQPLPPERPDHDCPDHDCPDHDCPDHDCRPTPPALDDPRLPPQVCNKFSAAAIAIKSPLVAVRPLIAAAAALQPGPTHFTPLHAECLKAPPHTHAPAACTHMHHAPCTMRHAPCATHHALSSSRRGSASLVPPVPRPPPRPCLPAPASRPPPRPTTPVKLSSHNSSLTRPPARPRARTGLHPRQDLHRRRADAAAAAAPGKPLPSLARPLACPCHRPLSCPAAALLRSEARPWGMPTGMATG